MLSESELLKVLTDQFKNLSEKEALELIHSATEDIERAKELCGGDPIAVFRRLLEGADDATKRLQHSDEETTTE